MQGKGNVLRRMLADVEADVYVMVDGDATYDATTCPAMVEKLLTERANERIGSTVDVLVERVAATDDDKQQRTDVEGRADHQAPEVDGSTLLRTTTADIGTIVRAVVVGANGADLVADPLDLATAR